MMLDFYGTGDETLIANNVAADSAEVSWTACR